MALVDLAKVFSVPGKLCTSPTDLTLPFPHGGTALGSARRISLITKVKWAELPQDPHGDEACEVVYLGSSFRLVATYRGFDPDAAGLAFPNTAAAPAGRPAGKTIEHPGTNRAGTLKSGAAVPLLFSPDDRYLHPAALLYRAVLIVDPGVEIAHDLGRTWDYTAQGIALRRASDSKAASVGLLEYLSL